MSYVQVIQLEHDRHNFFSIEIEKKKIFEQKNDNRIISKKLYLQITVFFILMKMYNLFLFLQV